MTQTTTLADCLLEEEKDILREQPFVRPAPDRKWFPEARFGLFVHYGLYAILGKGEWIMREELIPHEEYAKLAEQFDPKPGAITDLVRKAKESGFKYMVLTTRHHDGFCLYDSQCSNFKSKYDVIREYVDACRAYQMRIGLYYSLGDWRFGFPQVPGLEGTPETGRQMRQQAYDQIRELLSRYGKIDLLWYDGNWVYPSTPQDGNPEITAFWQSGKLNRMVRELQPHILINDRSGLPEDIGTCEGHITPERQRLWEACVTIGNECGWGYLQHNPAVKTAPQIIEMISKTVCQGGNFLLNVGLKPNGAVGPLDNAILTQVGTWINAHSEALYQVEPDVLSNRCVGLSCRKGKCRYFHILRWPGTEFTLTNADKAPARLSLLGSPAKIDGELLPHQRLKITNLPEVPPDPFGNVLKLEYETDNG